jgi:IS30 family transposase
MLWTPHACEVGGAFAGAVMLAKIPNRETKTVVYALIKQARKLPDELYKSLTWDNGKELADHQRFAWFATCAAL